VLAEALHIQQPAVAKMEKRTNRRKLSGSIKGKHCGNFTAAAFRREAAEY